MKKWSELLKIFVEGLILAFQLLSTIPLNKPVPYDQQRVRMAVVSFPLVGIVLGATLVGMITLLSKVIVVSPVVLALVVISVSIVYTGGLHLDGWMDCSDAFFSYQKKEKKLEIMKDSRIGAFAAISLVMLFAWKFVLIFEVFTLQEKEFLILIALIPFFSRITMGLKLYFNDLAKNEGMAYGMKKYIKKIDSISFFAQIIFLFFVIYYSFPPLLPSFLLLFISSIVFFFFSAWFDRKNFGGVTGDTLGASIEGGELWLWMILYLSLFFVTV